jgi:hypothetical protein
MSKTRDTGFLGNVIKVDASGNVSFVSGSTTLATINTSGQLSGSSPVLSASYASNAELLDGLDSTVFTLTSSFNAQTASFTAFTSSINSFSASILSFTASIFAQTASLNTFSASVLSYTSSLNAKTASFATTGSNTFTGIQTITGSVLQSGSFTSTGTLTAQTLVVQTITSSVVYSSGSNIFGNTIANTQTFTGSVLVTGSLTIAAGGNASAPTIFGSTIACSPIGCFATSCATSFIGGTMSGTTIYGSTAVCSPVGKFTSCIDAGSGTFSGNIGITVANTPQVLLTHSNTSKTFLMAVDGSNAFFRANSTNSILFQYAGGTTALTINGSTGEATFACSVTAGGYGAFTAGANGSPVLTLGTAGAINAVINTADEMFFNIDSNNDQGGARFVFGTNRTGTTGGSDLVTFSDNGSVSIGGSTPNATYLQLGDWCNRGGRLLTSNAAGWVGDGKTPLMVITSGNDTSTCKGNSIGLALHNDSQTCGSYTPALVFSRRSYSSIYNSAMAAIVAQSSLCGTDSNWNGGDLVFSTTPNGGYMTESMRITSTGITCFACQVCAPTFAGSTVKGSSNLDLNGNSGYLTLRTGDVTRLFVGSTGGVSVGAVSDPGVNNFIVAGTICSSGQVKGSSLFAAGSACGSGFRLGGSSYNVGYESDGLWGTNSTPNYIQSPVGFGMRIGYTDNGSGLYGAAYGFDVSYKDGLNNCIDYNAIIMRNSGQGTTPFRVTSYGNIYGTSKNFRIKHPIPSMNDTHYLIHTSIEGPQADLIYRGKVQLVNGKAEVNIDLASRMTDGTFEALCQDIQSYTTNESGWSLTKSYVIENILYIEAQDETSDDTISWLVIGERNDDGIKNSAITDSNGHVIVEELKSEIE